MGLINFNIPPVVGTEIKYIEDAIASHKICGDGKYTKKCNQWFESKFNAQKVMLTTSGSTALDMALLLCDLHEGDEVILPSYTFSSTANAAVLCGAKLVFVDVRPDTMNMDENLVEAAITERTKVIIVMHYAGVACNMDKIIKIARAHGIIVVEDAAQGVMSKYNNRYLGTIGDFGCYSFHETKNFSMGEGGALVINRPEYIEKAEILREKGTNRARYFRGEVDKYTWVEFGGSYLPSELNAAYLWAQLEIAGEITDKRLKIWDKYKNRLMRLKQNYGVEFQYIPENCEHNGHMFYIKMKNLEERTEFINYMKDNHVLTVFHYLPLHSAPAGRKYGSFFGEDKYTTMESERLVRLPLYYSLSQEDQEYVIERILSFYENCHR